MSQTQNWELFFPDAILSVEELLAAGGETLNQKSKLKIALDNKFLSWNDYKTWASNFYGLPVLEKLNAETIISLQKTHLEIQESYSQNLDFNTDFIALQTWDDQLIVASYEYNPDKVSSLKNVIFVLCSPENLTFISNKSLQVNHESKTSNNAPLNKAPHFSESGLVAHQVWQNLDTQHDSFSNIVRKNFDAYVVLKINSQQKTELFKMDEDLAKENIDPSVFAFDLKTSNPFTNVYHNQYTEQFSITQIGFSVLDFKYICITAIKLGPKVVGFIVGFKTTQLSQDDIITLESISDKAS